MFSLHSFSLSRTHYLFLSRRDYEKALGALKEAAKHIAKSDTAEATTISANLQTRIYVVEKFVSARRFMKTDASQAESICLSLSNQPGTEVEESIRVGDCYALLIEQYHGEGQWREAFEMMERMENRGIGLNPYLERGIMEDIYRGVGKTMPQANDEGGDDEGEIEDEIGEELDESLGSDDEEFSRK